MITSFRDRSRQSNLLTAGIPLAVLALAFLLGQRASALWLGLLVAAFLWINQFPDYRADRAAAKRNLVVRLGLERAALAYVVLLVTGYLWLLFTALAYPGASGLLWGLCGLAPALFSAWRTLDSGGVSARLLPAQVACLASFLLMASGAGLGYLASA